MSSKIRNVFHVLPQYQPLMRIIGLDAEAIFSHPDIVPWRKLPDRENCTLDAKVDGKAIRLHIKRYFAPSSGAREEVSGIGLLQQAQIPTMQIVGWGMLADGRSFFISEDLGDYRDAEKLVASGTSFERLLELSA